jgi:hypothetical protein
MFEKKKTMAMCHHIFLWCYCSEEGDGNLLPSPSSLVVFKRRRQRQLAVIAFFFVLEKKKTTTMCRHLFLWCCGIKKVTTTSYRYLLFCV